MRILLNSSIYRWIFIACLVTLGISIGGAGTVVFVRWQADRSARSDFQMILSQTGQQIAQEIEDRRRILTLLRDAVDKAPRLTEAEQTALLKSAMGHTPDLLGGGLLRKTGSFTWWVPPASVTPEELDQFSRETGRRTWLSTTLGLSSTRISFLLENHPLLLMIEPFRARPNRSNMIIAVYDLKALFVDFFKRQPQQPVPLKLTEGDRLLYRSKGWQLSSRGQLRPVIERTISFGGGRWSLQMQTGTYPLVPSSWLGLLVATVLVLAGLATSGMIWTAEQLRHLATTDELTGLDNRRFFFERWEAEADRAKRYGRNLSCLIIDVNGLKRVNDALGHQMGDRVLKQVAQELKTRLRRSDILARFGGDEFIAALPETNLQQALLVAEKLRGLSIQGPWAVKLGPVSLSAGLSQMEAGEATQQVIQRADANLYASRNPRRAAVY
ncbi:MAG: GGDEF domain-containing protein [Candidatus Omnitrophica bacterium]|nr:GGDEF domain-containing protein [Candidatus Omnitrophota bacterium]